MAVNHSSLRVCMYEFACVCVLGRVCYSLWFLSNNEESLF